LVVPELDTIHEKAGQQSLVLCGGTNIARKELELVVLIE
jgi:hypothetical protein